jgi:hypothetical protein
MLSRFILLQIEMRFEFQYIYLEFDLFIVNCTFILLIYSISLKSNKNFTLTWRNCYNSLKSKFHDGELELKYIIR